MTGLEKRAWLIEYAREDGTQHRVINLHNAIADYRVIDPKATVTVMVPEIDAEANKPPETVYCTRCRCNLTVGKHCKGNPPDDPCPLRPM